MTNAKHWQYYYHSSWLCSMNIHTVGNVHVDENSAIIIAKISKETTVKGVSSSIVRMLLCWLRDLVAHLAERWTSSDQRQQMPAARTCRDDVEVRSADDVQRSTARQDAGRQPCMVCAQVRLGSQKLVKCCVQRVVICCRQSEAEN